VSDALDRLRELMGSDPEVAAMGEGRKLRLALRLAEAARASPEEGRFDDEGLIQSRPQAVLGSLKRLSGRDQQVASRLLEAEEKRALSDRDVYWKEHGPEAARSLAGTGGKGAAGAWQYAKRAFPLLGNFADDPVDPQTKARLERGYSIGLRAALKDRILEEQPDFDPEKLDAEIDRRAQAGETISGGVEGFFDETLPRATLTLGKELPSLATGQLAASLIPGLGNAGAAVAQAGRWANVARVLGKLPPLARIAVRGAVGGALAGATGHLDPEVQRQLDEAGADWTKALAERGKQAVKTGVSTGAMGVLGELFGLGISKGANLLGKAKYAKGLEAGVRWERNPQLAKWMEENGGKVASLRITRAMAENVLADLTIAGVTDIEELLKNPQRVLAEATANAIAPSFIFGRASRELVPRQMAELRAAIVDNVFNVGIDDALRVVEGAPLRQRLALLKLYETTLTADRGATLGLYGSDLGAAAKQRAPEDVAQRPGRQLQLPAEATKPVVPIRLGPGVETPIPPAPLHEGALQEPAREARPQEALATGQIAYEDEAVARMAPGEALLEARPYETDQLQRLRDEVAQRASLATRLAKERGATSDWADIAGRRHRMLDELDAALALRKLDPTRGAYGERVAARAAAERHAGASLVQAKAQAELAAQTIEADAQVPQPPPPPASAAASRIRWKDGEVSAFQDHLKRLVTAKSVLATLGDKASKRSRLAREKHVADAEFALATTLAEKDGRSIADIERVPYADPSWVENPAQAAMVRAGWAFEDAQTGGRTADATKGKLRPQDHAAFERFVGQIPGKGDGFQGWLKAIVFGDKKVRMAAGDRPPPDMIESLVETAETAAMAAVAADVQQGGKDAGLVDRVRRAVRLVVQREASSFVNHAQRKAQIDAAISTQMAGELATDMRAATRAESESRSEGAVADAGMPSPGAPITSAELVLDMASQPGGPLHGRPDAILAARYWLHEVTAQNYSKQAGSDVEAEAAAMRAEAASATGRDPAEYARGAPAPQEQSKTAAEIGMTPIDIARLRFEAETGRPWSTLPPLERQRIVRDVQGEYAATTRALRAFMADTTRLREMGIIPVRDQNGQIVLKAEKGGKVELLHAGMPWSALFDTTDDIQTKRWTEEERAGAKPLRGLRKALERLGTGARDLGRSFLSAVSSTRLNGMRRLGNLRHEIAKNLPTWDALSEKARLVAFDAADGYRAANNGAPLDPDLARSRFQRELATLDPAERATAKGLHDFFRRHYDTLAEGYRKANPDQPLISKGYAAHVRAEDFVGREEMLAHFGESLQRALRIDDETASSLERAKTPGAAPGSERLMRRAPGERPIVRDLIKLLPQLQNSYDHLWRYETWHQWRDESLGKRGSLRVRGAQKLADYLSTWTDFNATRDTALQLENQGGSKNWLVVRKDDGGPKNVNKDGTLVEFQASSLGGGMTNKYRASLERDGSVSMKQWSASANEWQPVQMTARQGGIANLASRTHGKNGGTAVDRELLERATKRVEMIVGKEQLDGLQRGIQELLGWTSSRYIADGNWVSALKNALTQSVWTVGELGPKWFNEGRKQLASPEGRKLLRDMGIWQSQEVDPNHGAVRSVIHEAFAAQPRASALLDKGATTWQKTVARYRDVDSLARGLFQVGEDSWRAIGYLGARARALEQVKEGGLTSDEARLMTKRGVAAADQVNAAAHWRAIESIARTGALIDVTTQPLLMKSTLGRLLMQFKRPTIATLNYALSLSRVAAVELGTGAANSIQQRSLRPLLNKRVGQALAPIARWIAATTALASLDKSLGTNLFGGVGPRLVDLGQDTFGVSIGDAVPELDDPEEHPFMAAIGGMQVPLSDPMGIGPALSTMQRFGEAGMAWLRGDDEGLQTAFWDDTNSKRKILEAVVPFYQQAKRLSSLLDPETPMIGADLVPSPVASKPWMSVDARGRPVALTSEEAVTRGGLGGGLFNRQATDELRQMNSARRVMKARDRGFRAIRREWHDARLRLEVDGDPADYELVQELEAKADGMGRSLTDEDSEHEARLRTMPAWMRELAAGRTNDEKITFLLRRWRALGPDGSGSMSADELEWASNMLVKDFDSISPALQDAFAAAVQRASR
jgi:hypothetical protein